MFYRLRRRARSEIARALYSIDRGKLVDAFSRVGLRPGMTVCVHSAMSRLGYLEGGPAAIIEALIETVGPDGCIVMPTYPSAGSVLDYLDSGEPFNVRTTKSAVGSLTEVFRNWPGVKRSLHPTNPVATWGKGGEALIESHELSPTPYGDETPYGRMARMDNSYNLMMETSVLSLLHHMQERVDFPNYALPGEREATVIDYEGNARTVTTKVMRPRIPYYIAIPSQDGRGVEWAILHDFALVFPKSREREVREMGYRMTGYSPIRNRRTQLEAAGCLNHTKLGKGEIGLLRIKPFLEILIPELEELIERYRPYYALEKLEAADLPRYS